jgi:hypothetical protein
MKEIKKKKLNQNKAALLYFPHPAAGTGPWVFAIYANLALLMIKRNKILGEMFNK